MKRGLKIGLLIAGIAIVVPLVPIVFLCLMRMVVQTRYIPSTAMMPTLQIGDRIAIENTATILRRPPERGSIVVFYPPPSELPGGEDLSYDAPHILGRMTGWTIFPYESAYIKRVIGVPGDRIEIKRDVGVFVNGNMLNEHSYVTEPPSYSLEKLSDIGARLHNGGMLQPYSSSGPIIVPAGEMFVLGDNRNNSEDSHVFGCVKQDRIIGRAWRMLYPLDCDMHAAWWSRPEGNDDRQQL
jgi:signal peptidase I